MNENQLAGIIEPLLDQFGMELDKLDVVAAGRRRLVRITVDGDGADGHGPGLDEIGEASSAISRALDESTVTGEAPYTLEVSSRGVSTPLTRPRHYRRNVGRLLVVTLEPQDGARSEKITGRILAADQTGVTLEVPAPGSKPHRPMVVSREIPFDRIRRAVVQVELNRKPDNTEEN
ncbi:ribosome maturation factor RimP [Acidipropionibacterium thoenii]|uniref:ribosome maturation factor RimP n=1 Tax=Acidipropionibacterium thoenii TaxID=1751 RepID=UPI00040E5192|nr:ribosome maturation factor RimP [Acidipropionibacterium thoenii]